MINKFFFFFIKYTAVVVAFDWICGDLFVEMEFILARKKIVDVTDMKIRWWKFCFLCVSRVWKGASHFDGPYSILYGVMSLLDLLEAPTRLLGVF